ncbi:hypothetical protein EDD15DRAFT_2203168 [Pisolithus albus]|nr:hypothetical protein EDD15DRAFT_2203168 [Pisolithus albus]
MSIRRPRSHTPMSDCSPAEFIDWTTVGDDDLMPSATASVEVEIAKIDELARRQRERVFARRRQEEEVRRQKEKEDEHRRKEEEEQRRKEEEKEREAETRRLAEEEVRVQAEKDAENEAVVTKTISWACLAGVSGLKANRAFVLIPSKPATPHYRVSVIRDHPCTLCITTGEPCIDLPDSRSKQCAKCFQQKKGCRLPGEKIWEKRKDPQLSPRAGEKRKRVKVVGEDDHPRFVSTSMPIARTSAGPMGTSATAVPVSVARVLDQCLCEIASLLRNLVGQVRQSADPEGKGWLLEVDDFAVDEGWQGDDEADADGEDDTDLGARVTGN